ncbi:hypothetical protein BJ993_001064 [Nocardioides aromaticivorans]|uniref:Uncharacterized protein n=1 Tax=Nocardioides aromaticivorans TaxID=200618 RepID=A0A7Y9ZEK6_9ACTN|nr:hypothetical protein [Nocardioides aromaticivorans]NYI43984.1 hypothetical protein [Nocardioides aromaticivorans]QSR27946.1 hypothetical protein CFH99_20180 [Nocardioides aromaticivorans]
MAERDIDIPAWTDLDRLDEDMALLADQLRSITRYARTWVCQRAGFEPSPLCLLRPLAPLLDLVADGFLELERLALADWADLREGVAGTGGDLRELDLRVRGRMPVVA